MSKKAKIVRGIKRYIAISLVVLVLMQTVLSVTAFASYGNYSLLGTNEALGSPILNPNFVDTDWNRWEMVTWGIFLSNFAVPLIDDYQSAFDSNSAQGSRGAGYRALTFGSGSDTANKEVINDLLNYAIKQQKTGEYKEIYVAYSDVNKYGIAKNNIADAEDGEEGSPDIEGLRPAKFKDLFLATSEKEGDSWVELKTVNWRNVPDKNALTIEQENWDLVNYKKIATIGSGSLPTFYVRYGNEYEPIFDYTNGWDLQIMSAWIARAACGDYKKEFSETINSLWAHAGSLDIQLDCFGNIVVPYNGERRIIVPAAANQHLTKEPKINLINSLMFNGYEGNESNHGILNHGRQSFTGWFGGDVLNDISIGGLPAFGSYLNGLPQGQIMFYYDLDTLAYQTVINGGDLSNGTRSTSGKKTEYKMHYGRAVQRLMDLDINSGYTSEAQFKIEAANLANFNFANAKTDGGLVRKTFRAVKEFFVGGIDTSLDDALNNMLNASGVIANIAGSNTNAKVLTKLKTNNGDLALFGKPIIVPVQMREGNKGRVNNNSGAARMFSQFMYEAYRDGAQTSAGDIKREDVAAIMTSENSATMQGFAGEVLGTSSGKVSKLLAGFVAERDDLFEVTVPNESLVGAKIGDKSDPFTGMNSVKVDGKKGGVKVKFNSADTIVNFPGRLIKAYPISEEMKAVGRILGVREGSEHSLFSVYIYMTYLDWYGIRSTKLGSEATSEFNPRIFDGTSEIVNVDITSIADIKTDEAKRKEVLNYTYMLLHPTEGREYRTNMMQNYMTNFIYDNYQKIVYGNATSYYSSINSNLATRNAAGFLNMDTYEDNFMTGWFVRMYSKVAIFLIATSFILIIIVGALQGRKFSWVLIALIVMVNAILIVPATGEIAPMIANNYIQSIFKNKMTYWSISESVTNATLEAKSVEDGRTAALYMGGMTRDEQNKVLELVKSLNVVYLDRALMVKNDISRKVTQTQSGNLAEIQKLRSARWMLPMIMRQFTANDGSADYVYLPLGDVHDDLSNMYWLYKPEDAMLSGTVMGQQTTEGGENIEAANKAEPLTVSSRKNYYADYKDTSTNIEEYRSEAYFEKSSTEEMPHTYFYILRSSARPISRREGFNGEFVDMGSYDDYVKASLQRGNGQGFVSAATILEQQAGEYDRFDRSTVMPSYGYLWATESPYHYFYQVVKDTFPTDLTLGALVGRLQGKYIETDKGDEVRTSFMHAGETGYVKDILDLQELYTNMVPYLHAMQLSAGGMDGKSGLLGDAKIEEYQIYKENYKSWLFRSNWATKIMESPDLTRPEYVGDGKGNKIKIANPTLVDCYPDDRPMVFSEAQMHAQGLHEADLTLVELKNIEINKNVSRKWTMLLNYANVKGMTKEVMLRQMATEAVIEFNKVLSPNGILNGSYALYPNGLDLRAISFDSVMKMLMLNITRDTTYIYGDTMLNVISNSDMFTAFLLLISAFLCSYIIPFIRNVVMGLIFYLGLVAIMYSILDTGRQKAKISGGYLISNLIVLAMTLVYYSVFNGLMAATTPDSVLTVQSVQVNSGNPVWCFIIIIIISIAYIIGLLKMIDFCFKHYRDMGMAVYAAMAGVVGTKIVGGLTSIKNKITGLDDPTSVGSGDINIEDAQIDGDKTIEKGGSSIEDTMDIKPGSVEDNLYDEEIYGYKGEYYDDSDGAEEIDREIEKGREMDDFV